MGRLDDESTCNFGLIQGGTAANIIPDLITLRGEVRSHSEEKLQQYTKEIYDIFEQTIDDWQGSPQLNGEKPSVAIDIVADYPSLIMLLRGAAAMPTFSTAMAWQPSLSPLGWTRCTPSMNSST